MFKEMFNEELGLKIADLLGFPARKVHALKITKEHVIVTMTDHNDEHKQTLIVDYSGPMRVKNIYHDVDLEDL